MYQPNSRYMSKPDTSGVVDVAGFPLKYVIEGQGIPALVIGSAVFYPRVFSAGLRQHLQLIFIDHRGFVPPPPGHEHSVFPIDVLLEDIERIRQHLALETFVIIGHSGHAFLALEYAKKYPQYISGLVMIGVSPDYSEQRHTATTAFFEETASPERKAQLAENMNRLPGMIAAHPEKRFASYILSAGPQSWFDPAFNAAPLWEGVYTNMPVIDYVWGVVFRDIDITRGLAAFTRPVLLILGKYDYLVGPPELWEPVRNAFSDITIRVFDRSGHYPSYEEPQRFDAELRQWLAGIQPSV
jgi:proline iminopeptidase